MDKVKCPFCGSEDLKFKRKIVSPINNKKYEHWLCKSCYLEFFTPLIFEREIYVDGKIKSYEERHKGGFKRIPDWTNETIKILRNRFKIKDLSNKKILEVGAGDCINFVAFKEEFNISEENYYAIEFDDKSVETCKKRGVINIINEFFDEKILDKIKDKFDIILCFEVLEHQTKPKEFLDVCFKLLKEDGILIITVPNRDRFLMRFREISSSDIPPHHFLRFNKKFFIKNFKNELTYITCFSPNKYFYKSCKIISKILFKNENLWLFSIPVGVFLTLLNKFRPTNLLIILKKEGK